MVSTQAVRFDVPDLKATKLVAGDDALPGSARRVKTSTLTKDMVGIPDHFDMIQQAMAERSQQAAGDQWANESLRSPPVKSPIPAFNKLPQGKRQK